MPRLEDYLIKIRKEAKRRKDRLLARSVQTLLSLDTASLEKKGVKRALHLYEIFNQYPPYSILGNISEKDFFLNNRSMSQDKEGVPLSLYVHIPFCVNRCTFCCYFTVQGCSRQDKEEYISYLKKEIRLLLKKRYFRSRLVSSVYWGGGTPMLLKEGQISDLMRYIKDNFNISRNAEICCETTPEEASAEKLECLIRNGFNRLSIGVQTFEDKLYNRLHTGKDAINAFKLSRDAGFKDINIDLLFGLPGQNLKIWKRNIEVAEGLRPSNVTAYPFSSVNAFGELIRCKRPAAVLPGEEERLLMQVMAIEKFVASGYIQITPYQFISSRKYPFFQQEYKARSGEVYGLGVSGRSFIDNVEFRHYRSLPRYYRALDRGKFPAEMARRLNKKERMIKFFILSLQKTSGINRIDGGVDKALFKRMFTRSLTDVFKSEIRYLKDAGLIGESRSRIFLTYRGLLYPQETALFFYSKKDRDKITGPLAYTR